MQAPLVACMQLVQLLLTATMHPHLGLRWAMPRRNSSVWRFFCRGYVLGSHSPITSSSVALSSTACLAPTELTSWPDALMEAPGGAVVGGV